jgi:hypothetical protein
MVEMTNETETRREMEMGERWKPCLGSVTFGMNPDPDPALLVSDLQYANKILLFFLFSCLLHVLFEGTFI